MPLSLTTELPSKLVYAYNNRLAVVIDNKLYTINSICDKIYLNSGLGRSLPDACAHINSTISIDDWLKAASKHGLFKIIHLEDYYEVEPGILATQAVEPNKSQF